MKELDTGMMEEEIISEDANFQEPSSDNNQDGKISKFALKPKQVAQKSNKHILFFLKPKIIILIICLLTFLIILSSFLLIKPKSKTQINPDPNIVIATPQTETKIKNIDPALQRDLDAFSGKVAALKGIQADFSPPNIDFKSLSTF